MATTLWPVIHRLSDLPSLRGELELALRTDAPASKIAVLRTEYESTTQAIETALAQWQPHLPPGFVPDDMEEGSNPVCTGDKHPNINSTGDRQDQDAISNPANTAATPPPPSPSRHNSTSSSVAERARIHSILHNALAYRHSAFVYLYRSIYGHARSHATVQTHAHVALVHCVATVRHAGPMGALLWPLFTAACEAISPEDRELAGRAFAAIEKRQGMMNIERAWEIVQEVWRRADLAEFVAGLEFGLGTGGTVSDLESEGAQHHRHQDYQEKGDWLYRNAYEGHSSATSADLWRQVSKDMGVNIVFG